ncbi:MAG: hypothetical protein PGN34_13140 [Methylobacterium frigidaeris]
MSQGFVAYIGRGGFDIGIPLLFDAMYQPKSITRGRRFFDFLLDDTFCSLELWAGQHHLLLELRALTAWRMRRLAPVRSAMRELEAGRQGEPEGTVTLH